MEGAPGCGKTLMARVGVAEVSRISGKQSRFGVVKPGEWEDPFVGVTQANIRGAFRALREAADDTGFAVLFLDEIESVGRIRGSAVGHHSDKFLAALLAELDGFADRSDVAVIAATNRKGLCDPALLERFDTHIHVGRPDMRGAREILDIHLHGSAPYSPNGDAAPATRQEMIEHAISRLFSPNAENEICVIRFRDGKSRTVTARELVSGRLIQQICQAAQKSAFLRDVTCGEPGLRLEDMEEAVSGALERLSTTLDRQNAHHYLADLPQDVDVVAVEPVVRRTRQRHRFLNAC
jgi:SpoVK/Ycf46/Vps4 family AAA+-type ATPase